MVSRLRLCRATQFARASASATVPIASTSTASYSPKIKVDVIGSKPSASPKGFGRSPTIVFPGAVKTLTPSVFDAVGTVMFVVSLRSYDARIYARAPANSRPCADSVRWAQVGKRFKKIVVRPNVIAGHLPVGENSEEEIRNVVDERAAVVREGRGTFGIVAQKVWQEFPSHPFCFIRRIPARVFQSVREDGNETCIVRRLPGEVSGVLLAGKKGSLAGPRPTIRLGPAPTRAVCWNQRASPQPNLVRPRRALGTSSTMLQISLSAKKSPFVN